MDHRWAGAGGDADDNENVKLEDCTRFGMLYFALTSDMRGVDEERRAEELARRTFSDMLPDSRDNSALGPPRDRLVGRNLYVREILSALYIHAGD